MKYFFLPTGKALVKGIQQGTHFLVKGDKHA